MEGLGTEAPQRQISVTAFRSLWVTGPSYLGIYFLQCLGGLGWMIGAAFFWVTICWGSPSAE